MKTKSIVVATVLTVALAFVVTAWADNFRKPAPKLNGAIDLMSGDLLIPKADCANCNKDLDRYKIRGDKYIDSKMVGIMLEKSTHHKDLIGSIPEEVVTKIKCIGALCRCDLEVIESEECNEFYASQDDVLYYDHFKFVCKLITP